ncbi:MAG: diguanylate cyclase, partial [Synergistaceae bacterium]|nr:diguanylate cyclase [Synergistaceae bacterium]
AKEAAETAEKLRAGIEAVTVEYEGTPLRVTVSIGVTSTGSRSCEDETLHGLVGRADRALYRAKNSGRNRVCVFGEEDL